MANYLLSREKMNNILQEIITNKRLEVERLKEVIPESFLRDRLSFETREIISMKKAIRNSRSGIIAEFKRRSPSKGYIHENAEVDQIVKGYEDNGASAISCLTDTKFFGGGIDDFRKARKTLDRTPLLRKEFIIDEYQIYQSYIMGADAILLIASVLNPEEVYRFTQLAHTLEMEVLLEIHNKSDLSLIESHPDMVGINNRDLKTFKTDIRHSIALAEKLPEEFVRVSESGLSDPKTVLELRKHGFQGFLMGEAFMRKEDPAKELRKFMKKLKYED